MPTRIALQDTLAARCWSKVGYGPHHGFNVPLGAIRTEKSGGIGEFYDLFPLIDWCASIHCDVIQLLPLNESSGKEPSPYNALSSCALHPIYLSLHALPKVESSPILTTWEKQLSLLNQKSRIAYGEVFSIKYKYLTHYVSCAADHLRSDPQYLHFIQTQEWLLEYSLFKVFKEEYLNRHWNDWPEEKRNPTKTQKKKWSHLYEKELELHFFVQYLCFQQLQNVKRYAEKKKIWLKGDIPILVNPDSVDVWAHRSFFHLDRVVGRPPSNLEPEGQYWGFPAYNWKAMEEDHYSWWKKRLQVASQFYHLYRIDHVIGFFSLWVIPKGQHPSKGTYEPEDPSLMRVQGKTLLETLLSFTDMLPIGEDLGSTHHSFIQETLLQCGIPGTKIFRWQREWEKGGSFIPYEKYPPVSMSSVSTHDLDTLSLWWKNFPKESSAYAKHKKWEWNRHLRKEQILDILQENHQSASLFHINLLQEYLPLAPHLTFCDPQRERINYPGTIRKENWIYRYKETLERLSTDPILHRSLEKILSI